MSEDQAPTPSEIRAFVEGGQEAWETLLEKVMLDIDADVHRPSELTMENIDGSIGELAAGLMWVAAILNAHLKGESE